MTENEEHQKQHKTEERPESPEPGHPVEESQPPGGLPDHPHEHPEDIGETKSDEQGGEDVTQSPGSEPGAGNGA